MNVMDKYFSEIDSKLILAYDLATKAREKGYDPETKVETPLAKNLAERVEGLISAVAPQIKGSGVVERIAELEKEFKSQDWRVALKIAYKTLFFYSYFYSKFSSKICKRHKHR